jgi:hypothetical protein
VRSDQVDKLIAESPGLRALVRALTSPATPREMRGEQAALRMFRQVMAVRVGRSGLHRRPRMQQSRWRMAWIGSAAVLALTGSVAAASYVVDLGVSGSGPPSGGESLGKPSLRSGGGSSSPAQPQISAPGSPASKGHSLAKPPHALARVGAHVVTWHGTPRGIVVTCQPGQRGDVVELQVKSGARWRDLDSGRLDRSGQAFFALPGWEVRSTYRVALLGRAGHVNSVSRAMTISPHAGGDGRPGMKWRRQYPG